MNDLDTAFFAAEAAAQAAAENTVDRYAQQRGAGAGCAVAAIAVVAIVAYAWKSPLGRKARNKIAAAIKAD